MDKYIFFVGNSRVESLQKYYNEGFLVGVGAFVNPSETVFFLG